VLGAGLSAEAIAKLECLVVGDKGKRELICHLNKDLII
jgi:hypothetical protein